ACRSPPDEPDLPHLAVKSGEGAAPSREFRRTGAWLSPGQPPYFRVEKWNRASDLSCHRDDLSVDPKRFGYKPKRFGSVIGFGILLCLGRLAREELWLPEHL